MAVRAGDDDAFEALYRRYHERIAAYVRKMVGDKPRTEDITQEVFLSALRRMRQTDGRLLVKPWLYEIAKNACIDQFRRSRRVEEFSYEATVQLDPADYDRLTAAVPGPDAAVDTKLALDALCGAFGSLSDIHHEVLVLREFEGRSYREIGERLGLSRPAVESTLFRARRRLTHEYDELASGRSCVHIQHQIALAARDGLGAREHRRMARHLSHCAPCRRQAVRLGVDGGLRKRRQRRGMASVAAVIPWPTLLTRRFPGRLADLRGGSTALGPHAGARVAQLSAEVARTGDGAGVIWGKLVVGAVAVAAVSMGTHAPTAAHRHHSVVPPPAPGVSGAPPARSPAVTTPTPSGWHHARELRVRSSPRRSAARSRWRLLLRRDHRYRPDAARTHAAPAPPPRRPGRRPPARDPSRKTRSVSLGDLRSTASTTTQEGTADRRVVDQAIERVSTATAPAAPAVEPAARSVSESSPGVGVAPNRSVPPAGG